MKYVGVDIGKRHFTATVLDQRGNVLSKDEVPMDRAEIRKYFKRVNGKEPLSVVLKPRNCWGILYDELDGRVKNLTVAHPANLKAIDKTIKRACSMDSEVLAQMLRSELIPAAYVPGVDTRDKKNLVRYRLSLVRMRTILKNMVHALLSRNHVDDSAFIYLGDRFCTKGIEQMRGLRLRGTDHEILNHHLDMFEVIREKIKQADRKIKEISEDDEVCRLLKSVPGIGEFFAVLIKYEMDDVRRFSSIRKLFSYAGLAPGKSSGENGASLDGAKGGNRLLRWALKSAAQKAGLRDAYLRGLYERKEKQSGKKAARMVVARRLLEIIHRIWKEESPYYSKNFV